MKLLFNIFVVLLIIGASSALSKDEISKQIDSVIQNVSESTYNSIATVDDLIKNLDVLANKAVNATLQDLNKYVDRLNTYIESSSATAAEVGLDISNCVAIANNDMKNLTEIQEGVYDCIEHASESAYQTIELAASNMNNRITKAKSLRYELDNCNENRACLLLLQDNANQAAVGLPLLNFLEVQLVDPQVNVNSDETALDQCIRAVNSILENNQKETLWNFITCIDSTIDYGNQDNNVTTIQTSTKTPSTTTETIETTVVPSTIYTTVAPSTIYTTVAPSTIYTTLAPASDN